MIKILTIQNTKNKIFNLKNMYTGRFSMTIIKELVAGGHFKVDGG